MAERILTLGYTSHNGYSQLLPTLTVFKEEIRGKWCVNLCLKGTLEGLKVLLEQQREILELAGESDDEGTASQMSDYIKEQEKLVWMFQAACQTCHA